MDLSYIAVEEPLLYMSKCRPHSGGSLMFGHDVPRWVGPIGSGSLRAYSRGCNPRVCGEEAEK